MPRQSKELSSLEVKRLEHPGKGRNVTYAVGGVAGLLLQITPNGGRTWLLRTVVGSKRREIGLGRYPSVSLSQARESARVAREKIRSGADPIEERKAARAALVAAQRRGLTFETAVERYLDAKLEAFQNAKHRSQWRSTLESYAKPELGTMLVSEIEVRDILRVLEPIWSDKTETATRVRGRIEAVLSWATVAGHRTGDNPARWAGNLKELLPAPNKVSEKGNQPALDLDDVPKWFAALRKREGAGARALEFLALTAARSGEVRGALWEEIDFERGLWTVPAARMKMSRDHRVPLVPAAKALLEEIPRTSDLIFAAPRGGPLSDMTLSATMRRLNEAEIDRLNAIDMAAGLEPPKLPRGFIDSRSKRPAVPHGLRSTFRDWAAEKTSYPGDMAEVALAHKISNAVEAAYRRGDMIEKRRAMMAAWADFLAGEVMNGRVVRIA